MSHTHCTGLGTATRYWVMNLSLNEDGGIYFHNHALKEAMPKLWFSSLPTLNQCWIYHCFQVIYQSSNKSILPRSPRWMTNNTINMDQKRIYEICFAKYLTAENYQRCQKIKCFPFITESSCSNSPTSITATKDPQNISSPDYPLGYSRWVCFALILVPVSQFHFSSIVLPGPCL